MSDAWDRERREAAMKRRVGMKPDALVKLREFNAEQTDWYARCRVCGRENTGTLAQVSKCDHGGEHGE